MERRATEGNRSITPNPPPTPTHLLYLWVVLAMYNPQLPNSYRDVKVTRWKRAREEERRNDVARSLAAAGGAAPSPLHLLSAEELHRRRVRQSAALGVRAAVEMMREEFEAAHKTRVAEGDDRRGRIRQKLGRLMDAAATAGAKEMAPPPVGIFAAPLVFQKTDLAAGGYVVRETGGGERRRGSHGKPSSTILIRFLRDGPPVEIFDTKSNNAEARNAFLEAIQDECGQCGVVRSVRYALLSDEEQATLRERLKKAAGEEGDSSVTNLEVRLAREMIRVFVRFDAVANAFKALETLQQRHDAVWEVSFFPTQLFDAGTLGPAEGEPLCSV